MINKNWQKAKQILDNMTEPNIDFREDKKHLDVYRPNIMEFPCQYVKHKTTKGIKSWLLITNSQENCVYLKNFSLFEKENSTF